MSMNPGTLNHVDERSKPVDYDQLIDYMVSRFLAWRLPDNFRPDNGISYTRPNYAASVDATPTGTNLFDVTQADRMMRHIVEGLTFTQITAVLENNTLGDPTIGIDVTTGKLSSLDTHEETLQTVLDELLQHIGLSHETHTSDLLHRSPAEQMRKHADDIEARDRAITRARVVATQSKTIGDSNG